MPNQEHESSASDTVTTAFSKQGQEKIVCPRAVTAPIVPDGQFSLLYDNEDIQRGGTYARVEGPIQIIVKETGATQQMVMYVLTNRDGKAQLYDVASQQVYQVSPRDAVCMDRPFPAHGPHIIKGNVEEYSFSVRGYSVNVKSNAQDNAGKPEDVSGVIDANTGNLF